MVSIIRDVIEKKMFRINNKHNSVSMVGVYDKKCVSVGKYSYGGINCLSFNSEYKLKIGNFVSIAPGTTFVLSADHNINCLSTFPFKAKILKMGNEGVSKGDIVIEDDVWIGQNAIVLSGVHVGQGAVIAAGTVVSKDVPPYSVVAGVPAKIIKYRFKKEIIDYLISLDYSRLNGKIIQKNIDKLYTPLEGKSVSEIQKLFKWFPKRKATIKDK